jgi:hypothetical protein
VDELHHRPTSWNPNNWAYVGYAVMGRREAAEALAASHDDPRGQMMIYCGLGDKDARSRPSNGLRQATPGAPRRGCTGQRWR